MFEQEDQERSQSAVTHDILQLLREHERLRNDVQQLLLEKQQLLRDKEQKNGDGTGKKEEQKGEAKQEGKTQDKRDKNQGGGEKGDEKKGDEKKDDDNQNKEEKKPPLKERAKTWAHAHPVGVVLIVIGLIALLIAAFFFWRYLQSFVDTDDAEVDGHTNQISSRVSGTVIGVYVENTRTVSQGQLLVDLDPRDYQTALAQAQANLAQAIAGVSAQSPNVPITQTSEATNVATAELNIATADSALQAARQTHQSALAELEQAKANADNAAKEEVRYRHLADKEEVSRELYDEKATQARAEAALVDSKQAAADAAGKAVNQREAELAQVRERYKEAESNQPRQVAVQHATVESRQAGVQAARAQVAQAQLNLTYCRVLAPVSGIVGDKTVEVGQQISPGEELFAITPTDDIWVTANFKETEIIHVRPGQGVTIHVDAVDLDFDGYVEHMPGATGAKYSLLPPEKRHGQLRQGGAAIAGANPLQAGAARSGKAAARYVG